MNQTCHSDPISPYIQPAEAILSRWGCTVTYTKQYVHVTGRVDHIPRPIIQRCVRVKGEETPGKGFWIRKPDGQWKIVFWSGHLQFFKAIVEWDQQH